MNPTDPREKALAINLDPLRYGTFAEIGAGQEVVRWFFRVGAAAGTISKSISAYDMTVSDAIYGACPRYVCRERLEAMLNHEHDLNLSRLAERRAAKTAFFVFADTVVARSFGGTHECHGWMGVKFQARPGARDSQILMHVRMLDNENTLQQEALGTVGVNLLYGAFNLSGEPDRLVESLLDGLRIDRIEIDMIEFSGQVFEDVDNRVMSLRLVQLDLSDVAMFDSSGAALIPSEVLYKRAVLVERGRFRPVTHVNVDMMDSALDAFEPEPGDEQPLTIMEITMNNLMEEGEIDLPDFVARAEVLAATQHVVMISDYFEFHRLASYLRRQTDREIGIVMGAGSLRELFDERYYEGEEVGILEAFGRLFKSQLKLFIYPLLDSETGELHTAENLELPGELRGLYQHFLDRGYIQQLHSFRREVLPIFSPDVLQRIQDDDPSWEEMVPSAVADVIKRLNAFGVPGGG